MLKHWQTHAEYQYFIFYAVSHLNVSQRKKLQSYSDSIEKLTSLNLDPVGEFMAPFYSHTGRPALNLPQILCSFVLFMDLHYLSIDSYRTDIVCPQREHLAERIKGMFQTYIRDP